MNATDFVKIAGRLMSRPAVPYQEEEVRAEVEQICQENGLAARRDDFGNVHVTLAAGGRTRPLVLAAHMDHPGFRILRGLNERSWLAEFLGGVPDIYFRRGQRLRLQPGGTRARLGEQVGRERTFAIRSDPLKYSRPRYAVWDLIDFEVRDGKIYGRACDDLIGVATILATLIELNRERRRVNVRGVISRAEEVGFQGALAAGAAGLIPRSSLVISLETSRELPSVKMGQGVIIRVGDRSAIFDPAATRFLGEVAAGLQARNGFHFQRALMSGGTCEGTAYQGLGFQTGAVCVALGNYHNCGAGHRIAPEFVSVADACSMVQLLATAAVQMTAYPKLVERLPRRLQGLLREARQKLRSRAPGRQRQRAG